MNTAEDVARALGGAKKSGDRWMCQCPCHEDKNPSLALKDSKEGHLIPYCHAGCMAKDIYRAISARGVSYSERPFSQRQAHKTNIAQFSKPKKLSHEIEQSYDYTNENGEVLFSKKRYYIKGEKRFTYIYPNDVKPLGKVLYNLPSLISAREKGLTVYLCEGEKDADKLTSLGLVATTNPEGASLGKLKWQDSYTQALSGQKEVVIFVDNDAVGRAHAYGVASLLNGRAASIKVVEFLELPDKGDVSDYLDGHSKEDLLNLVNATPMFSPSQGIKEGLGEGLAYYQGDGAKSKRPKATFEDVCRLIRDTFPGKPPKTDLFSGSLHVWHKGKYLKAEGRGPWDILNTKMRHSDRFFSHEGLPTAINTYADMLTPELLIEIPTWDERDRVSEFADVCNVVNIPKRYFSEFLKAWGAKMFLRAHDNRKHQNQCIILQGEQGIGKDTWIDTFVGGLEMYAENYIETNDEVRKAQILSSLLVVKVPEFERLNKTDPAVLKNDITSSGTLTIGKYGRAVERFENRCSWIASANTFDFFRDHTGNRRFWVFSISGKPGEAIRRGYPTSEQDKLQVLAQFKQLAANGYEVSDHAAQSMKEFIQNKTPQDPVGLLLFDFDSSVTEKMREVVGLGIKKGDFKGFSSAWKIPNHYLVTWGIFNELSKQHGIPQRTIQIHLTTRGRNWSTGRARGYIAQDTHLLGATEVTDVEREVSQEVSHLSV